jgi:hypothetical protein
MASWGAMSSKALRIRINGEEKASYIVASNVTNVILKYTGHKYDIGLKRNQSTVFHGYIRGLAVHSWPADTDKVASQRIQGKCNNILKQSTEAQMQDLIDLLLLLQGDGTSMMVYGLVLMICQTKIPLLTAMDQP